jgi:hypothetical protein
MPEEGPKPHSKSARFVALRDRPIHVFSLSFLVFIMVRKRIIGLRIDKVQLRDTLSNLP